MLRYDDIPDDRESRAFLEGAPVAAMTGDEVPHFAKASGLTQWADEHFARAVGNVVEHPRLGLVILNRRSIKDTLTHGYGPDKVQALYLLPEAFPKARVIESLPGRGGGANAYMLAAPITIGSRRFVMAMLTKPSDDRQRLYVHEVALLDSLQAAIKTGKGPTSSATADPARSEPGTIRNILARIFRSNDGDVKF